MLRNRVVLWIFFNDFNPNVFVITVQDEINDITKHENLASGDWVTVRKKLQSPKKKVDKIIDKQNSEKEKVKLATLSNTP